jgi:hypothetical protein
VNSKQRTNNFSERYNKRFNALFPTPHPSLATFVEALKTESESWATKWKEARSGKIEPRKAGEIVWPEIPSDYTEFWMLRMLSEEDEKEWKPTREVKKKKAIAALSSSSRRKRAKKV